VGAQQSSTGHRPVRKPELDAWNMRFPSREEPGEPESLGALAPIPLN